MKQILITLTLFTACFAAVSFPDNLLMRLPFDNAPVHDVSPYQRNLVWAVAGSAPTLVAGKYGQACPFNAAGGQTDAYFTGQWQAGPTFSAMSWVLFKNLDNYPKIMSQKNRFDDEKGWEFQYNAGVFSLVPAKGKRSATSTSFTYKLNTWYHIAMTVDNGAVKFYRDGVDMTANGAADPTVDFGGKDITVGASANGAVVNGGGQWQGALDEVRVYDFALTPAQIQQVYSEDPSVGSVADPSTPLTKIQDSCVAKSGSTVASSIQLEYADLPNNAGTYYPGRSAEYMSFSYFASYIADGGKVKTTGTLRINNKGTDALTINSVTINPATADTRVYFTQSGINNGQQIAAGASATINVNFNIYTDLRDKTVVHNFMSIKSSDPTRPEIVVTLAGVYMTKKEGGDEIALQSTVNAVGLAVNTGVGYVAEGIERLENNIIGDGFSSFLLKVADTSLPIWLQTIASFAPCCTASGGVQLNNGLCPINVQAGYSQSVYPQKTGGGVAFATCKPTTNFWLLQDGQWASNSAASSEGFISMHMAPARDQDGQLIKNTYVLGQDYSLKTGCGFKTGQANCDFNDNQFLIANVQPADSAALDRSAVVALPISAAFDHTFSSGLVDSVGNFVGFPQYTFSTKLDTSIRVKSYQPSLLSLDTTNKVLKVKASGSLVGGQGDLVNGLRYPIDPARKSFAVSASVASAPAGSSAGVFLGSDEDNFVSLTVSSGVITAYAELYSFYQLQRGGDIGYEPTINVNTFRLGNVTLPSGTSQVELVIFADPTDGVTGSVSFGYNVGNGVVLMDGKWTLPGRNPTTGLGASGRILGFGTAAGIVAAGSGDVTFSSFSVSNCAATVVTSAPTPVETPAPTNDQSGSPSGSPTDSPNNGGTSAPVDTNQATTPATATPSGPQNNGGNPTTNDTGVGRAQNGSARIIVPTLFAVVLAILAL